jgi:membrane associated rhomboid family serine protease
MNRSIKLGTGESSMIETTCTCRSAVGAAESEINQPKPCPKCGAQTYFIAAEQISDGAGAADFDTMLLMSVAGDDGKAQPWQFFLGGVPDIEIGKLPDKQIVLSGSQVSRFHCRISRLDFGPSRWKVVDNKSTNGTFVNGQRIDEHELQDGDVINVGGNELTFRVAAPAPPPVPVPTGPADGIPCPSCGNRYPKRAKICVACGVDLRTGRPLITSHGFDEDDLQVKAENTIRLLSWVVPTGLFPVASEAFGTRKPYTIWTIAAITVLISIPFWLFVLRPLDDEDEDQLASMPPSATLMLWAGREYSTQEIAALEQRVRSYDEVSFKAIKDLVSLATAKRPHLQFHWYQFVTHAFLHGGLMHLAGNFVFLFVFGTRVNALIGNIATAVAYLILAVIAGAAHMMSVSHEPLQPMLGASGAIMGLAGMYFVFFPVHRVFMAIWIRWGWLSLLAGRPFALSWKVWALRGFWVVLFYLSFDIFWTAMGVRTGTAHWAHLGGFIAGMAIAVIMLLARLVNARGGDILSRLLGKNAWALIGRPADAVAAA